jgi:hypothetical protein
VRRESLTMEWTNGPDGQVVLSGISGTRKVVGSKLVKTLCRVSSISLKGMLR